MNNEKLVRDKIPELIESSGTEPIVRTAIGEELDLFFRAKIVEEAKEFYESGDTEELVDIFEILDAYMHFKKIDMGLIEMQQHAKKMARGGFTKGLILKVDE